MIQEEDESEDENSDLDDDVEEPTQRVSNGDRIFHGWNHLYDQNVLDIYQNKQNPLKSVVANMKVSYTKGGFFNIKNVRWSPEG